MASVFDPVRDPDRWTFINREFRHGAHWRHSVERLIGTTIYKVNDCLFDEVKTRRHFRFGLSGRENNGKRILILYYDNDPQTRFPLMLGENSITLNGNIIKLGNEAGPTRLVNALVGLLEEFWNSHGY